jgi:hypothetical protein
MSESAESEPQTEHTIEGTIGNVDVEVSIEGPESQVLDEGSDKIASNHVYHNLSNAFDEVKQEMEAEA